MYCCTTKGADDVSDVFVFHPVLVRELLLLPWAVDRVSLQQSSRTAEDSGISRERIPKHAVVDVGIHSTSKLTLLWCVVHF